MRMLTARVGVYRQGRLVYDSGAFDVPEGTTSVHPAVDMREGDTVIEIIGSVKRGWDYKGVAVEWAS